MRIRRARFIVRSRSVVYRFMLAVLPLLPFPDRVLGGKGDHELASPFPQSLYPSGLVNVSHDDRG